MKKTLAFLALAAAGLGGCAVTPAYPVHGSVYVAPRPYYRPAPPPRYYGYYGGGPRYGAYPRYRHW